VCDVPGKTFSVFLQIPLNNVQCECQKGQQPLGIVHVFKCVLKGFCCGPSSVHLGQHQQTAPGSTWKGILWYGSRL